MKIKGKAYGVLCFLVLMLCAAAWSIYTVSGGTEYVAAVTGQSVYRLDVAQSRGTIYDSSLEPITGSEKKLVAAVAPTIEAIGALETATGGEYRERLATALHDGKPFMMEIPFEIENGCVDVFTIAERYAENQPAPHVVGYLDSMGSGAAGIELAMDDVLAANSGEIAVYYQVDALGRALAGGNRQVKNTLSESRGGVAVTLDLEIQAIAEEAAKKLKKGAVVITEVPNCEIRALVSMPDFEPNDIGAAVNAANSPLVNRAFSAYAPGSVFKIVTAVALIENGAVLESFNCAGSISSDGLIFNCYNSTAHGEIDLQGAVEKSCNCYFIAAARALGGQSILSAAYNLGFGVEQEFGRGLITSSGALPEATELSNVRALANFSFGQGELTATPLQICGMMNAVAAGGVYYSPKLIEGVVTSEREIIPHEPVTDKTVRVMELYTAQELQKYLESAAKNGTGAAGAPTNCISGIKTGTAQTGVFDGEEELLHFWYSGYIRTESEPRYCVTVLNESCTDDKGITARVFKEICEKLAEFESENAEQSD